MRLLFGLFLLISGVTPLFAQPRIDSIRVDGVRFGADLIGLGSMIAGRQGYFDFAIDANQERHHAAVEFGSQIFTRAEPRFDYETNGQYLRLGYDKNLMRIGDEMLFVGGRIAFAQFEQSAPRIDIEEPYYNVFIRTSGRPERGSVTWLEFTGGAKARLFARLYAGITVRAKVMLREPTLQLAALHYPGFGVAGGNLNLGLNYYLQYKIGWKKYVFNETKKR